MQQVNSAPSAEPTLCIMMKDVPSACHVDIANVDKMTYTCKLLYRNEEDNSTQLMRTIYFTSTKMTVMNTILEWVAQGPNYLAQVEVYNIVM